VTGSVTGTQAAVGVGAVLVPVAVAYLLMLRGWRRRAHRHALPPLTPVGEPAEPLLGADGRYFGSTLAGDWLDRVVARGLGTRSTARLVLSAAGLDVHRPRDSFRVPSSALRAARHDQGIAGKVVPPQGLLVVTWLHGGHLLDSGFRLADSAAHPRWVGAITRLADKEHTR
jgi:hypothetical protein